jgi:hypothetical protein
LDDGGTQLILNEDLNEETAWYRFVSKIAMADGLSKWTVDFPHPSEWTGWIGIGVTIKQTNLNGSSNACSYNAIADNNDWILSVREQASSVYHSGTESDTFFYKSATSTEQLRACFTADRSTGTVRVRLTGTEPAIDFELRSFDADLFELLRPCVVLAGPMDAVVRSGASDD